MEGETRAAPCGDSLAKCRVIMASPTRTLGRRYWLSVIEEEPASVAQAIGWLLLLGVAHTEPGFLGPKTLSQVPARTRGARAWGPTIPRPSPLRIARETSQGSREKPAGLSAAGLREAPSGARIALVSRGSVLRDA